MPTHGQTQFAVLPSTPPPEEDFILKSNSHTTSREAHHSPNYPITYRWPCPPICQGRFQKRMGPVSVNCTITRTVCQVRPHQGFAVCPVCGRALLQHSVVHRATRHKGIPCRMQYVHTSCSSFKKDFVALYHRPVSHSSSSSLRPLSPSSQWRHTPPPNPIGPGRTEYAERIYLVHGIPRTPLAHCIYSNSHTSSVPTFADGLHILGGGADFSHHHQTR